MKVLFFIIGLLCLSGTVHASIPRFQSPAPFDFHAPAAHPVVIHRVGFIVYLGSGLQCLSGKMTVSAPRHETSDTLIQNLGTLILKQPEIIEQCPNAKVLIWLIPGISM